MCRKEDGHTRKPFEGRDDGPGTCAREHTQSHAGKSGLDSADRHTKGRQVLFVRTVQ
jgi:hypothetical protein